MSEWLTVNWADGSVNQVDKYETDGFIKAMRKHAKRMTLKTFTNFCNENSISIARVEELYNELRNPHRLQ